MVRRHVSPFRVFQIAIGERHARKNHSHCREGRELISPIMSSTSILGLISLSASGHILLRMAFHAVNTHHSRSTSMLGCIPVIAPDIEAAGAAERQNVSSRGWSAAQPPESRSCGPCRVAALQLPDVHTRGAATRLPFVSAGDQGLRCASPLATQVAPLRGGLFRTISRSAACSLRRRTPPCCGGQPRLLGNPGAARHKRSRN